MEHPIFLSYGVTIRYSITPFAIPLLNAILGLKTAPTIGDLNFYIG